MHANRDSSPFTLWLRGGNSIASDDGPAAAEPQGDPIPGAGREVDEECALQSLKLMAARLHMVRVLRDDWGLKSVAKLLEQQALTMIWQQVETMAKASCAGLPDGHHGQAPSLRTSLPSLPSTHPVDKRRNARELRDEGSLLTGSGHLRHPSGLLTSAMLSFGTVCHLSCRRCVIWQFVLGENCFV